MKEGLRKLLPDFCVSLLGVWLHHKDDEELAVKPSQMFVILVNCKFQKREAPVVAVVKYIYI